MLESITVENIFCFKNSTTLSFLAGKERNRNTDEQYCGFTSVNKQNILKPSYVDEDTGSRYYTSDDLVRLQQIMELASQSYLIVLLFLEDCYCVLIKRKR